MGKAKPVFEGKVGRYLEESEPWWPPIDEPPAGSPNVVVVLLDDVGYAQFGCYGSDIATPTFDRLAAGGLRYSNFHTTALCSPTRACLLSGRNHHSNGMGRIVEVAAGFPGYNATIPKENGFLSEILLETGYATFAVGKWHLAPATEMTMGSPRDKWPLGRGFERFYGFMGGETDQYFPDLVHDNHNVAPPRTPEEGYHLTEDLADQALLNLADLRATSPTRPFLLWFAPGACHAPHQAPRDFIDAYRGQFDDGWDAWRDRVFAKQVATGLLPEGTELSERPSWVPPWDTLSTDEHRLYARMMEVYAGFLTHTDAQVGRIVDFVDQLGELDNTIFIVMSDNGASAEGGAKGSFNEGYFFNFVPESLEENLARIDDLGSPRAFNHYPWGWAWAGNTPLKRFKRDTHEGGVADPLIVHWPARFGDAHAGETRHQYVHAIDLLPTLLEWIGIEAPATINGIEQSPIEGTSFAGDAVHHTQYYEMLGSRALYHDGWKAVVYHPGVFTVYDGTDVTKPFDDDVWELYHVAVDFAEVHDLAATEPDKLEEMKQLWWTEAEKFQVLPLNNQPVVGHDGRYRRAQYVFHPGIGPMSEDVAPALKNRPFTIQVELDVPAEGSVDGVIVAHGSVAGGYVLYLKDRRLHYSYNFVGTQLTTVNASVELPVGQSVGVVRSIPNGTGGSDVELRYGDVPVGNGTVPRNTPVTYGMSPFTVGYYAQGSIDGVLQGRSEVSRDVVKRVVVDVIRKRDLEAQETAARGERADMATQ
ncbi:MAG TPA: arylsulfatase [Acidimicrobiales bacterium]|nr:arylsulfatase [Acidimicrobiales bacterium]